MTREQLMSWVDQEVCRFGSQKAAAEAWNISQQHLCDLRHGRREPGEKVLTAWGFRKVVKYERYEERQS